MSAGHLGGLDELVVDEHAAVQRRLVLVVHARRVQEHLRSGADVILLAKEGGP
jgi:hypothetical protein